MRLRFLDPQTRVLAPHAADRQHLVPDGPAQDQPHTADAPPRPCRHAWQQLLARVFQMQLKCPRCAGPRRVLATFADPHSIRTYLTGVGLDSRPAATTP